MVAVTKNILPREGYFVVNFLSDIINRGMKPQKELMQTVTEQQVKNNIYSFIKNVKQNYNPNQPWLTPQESKARNTYASSQGRRADQNGTIRNLKMSDMGTVLMCEKSYAGSYSGISQMKLPTVYASKGGTLFHNEMERLALQGWETPRTHRNNMFTKTPPVGNMTLGQYNGKKSDGVWGQMDAYIPSLRTIVEFKSTWDDEILTHVAPKAFGQGSLYVHSKQKDVDHIVWVYLPGDLTKLNPALHPETYQVFYHSKEEMLPIAENIIYQNKRVAAIIDQHGYDNSLNILQCYTTDCAVCGYMVLNP